MVRVTLFAPSIEPIVRLVTPVELGPWFFVSALATALHSRIHALCTGFEPVASRVTGGYSPPELTQHVVLRTPTGIRTLYPRVKISDLNP